MANLLETTIDGNISERLSQGASSWSGTTAVIDITDGNFFQANLSGLSGDVTTFTINGTIPSGEVASFTLEMRTTGARDFTWDHANMENKFHWPGGGPPTITAQQNQTDIYSFTSWDQGTTWYGTVIGQNFEPN